MTFDFFQNKYNIYLLHLKNKITFWETFSQNLSFFCFQHSQKILHSFQNKLHEYSLFFQQFAFFLRSKHHNMRIQFQIEEKQKNLDKLNTALDKAGVPVPKDTFPKTTAAFEEVARSDKERFDRKAEKTSGGGGGGGIPSDKMDKMKKMNYKAGGKVKSASSRADGCAIRGKTRA
jgi:hypothetical protein